MKPSGDQLRTIANYIEAGKIKPVIDRVFPFEDAQKSNGIFRGWKSKGENNCKNEIIIKPPFS